MTDDEKFFNDLLKRIATGPRLSKDLTREEARMGMALILGGKIDAVQIGIFLIALRMKRETPDENRGVLDAIRDVTDEVTVRVDELVDLAEPYDGYARHVPIATFLPAVLAACGLPTVIHGCAMLAPKFGVTPRRILDAAGVDVARSPKEVAAMIENPDVGWAYIDQHVFCPRLEALSALRKRIVKRPCLSTLEKLSGPVRAKGRTHLVVGFVHDDYQELMTAMARHAGFQSALVVRGVEGGIIPMLNRETVIQSYMDAGDDVTGRLVPADADVERSARALLVPESHAGNGLGLPDVEYIARLAASAGMNALTGENEIVRDSIVLAVSNVLVHLHKAESIADAASQVRAVLDDGTAWARFNAGK